MRSLLLFLLVVMAGSVRAELRAEWRTGHKAYRNEAYADAAQHYEAARGLIEETDPETEAELTLNLGTARFRNGELDAAAEAFIKAARTPDLEVQADAHYNLGCVRLARGNLNLEENQLKEADARFAEAMDALEEALKLRPEDPDAKINYELALRERLRMRGFVLAVRERLANADRLVKETRYEEALDLLSRLDEETDAATQLDEELKTALEQRQQRTGQLVDLIRQLRGETPAAPGGAP